MPITCVALRKNYKRFLRFSAKAADTDLMLLLRTTKSRKSATWISIQMNRKLRHEVLAWLIWFASGHSTSIGCEDNLASSSKASLRWLLMNSVYTFHSGKILRRREWSRSRVAISTHLSETFVNTKHWILWQEHTDDDHFTHLRQESVHLLLIACLTSPMLRILIRKRSMVRKSFNVMRIQLPSLR